jgi:hypothetical protein
MLLYAREFNIFFLLLFRCLVDAIYCNRMASVQYYQRSSSLGIIGLMEVIPAVSFICWSYCRSKEKKGTAYQMHTGFFSN